MVLFIRIIPLLGLVLGQLTLLPLSSHQVGFRFQVCFLFAYLSIFSFIFQLNLFHFIQQGICLGHLIQTLLCPRYVNISCIMVFFGLSCRSITLMYLVVMIFLMCQLIYIWILPILSVGHNRFHLIVERSGKGRGMIIPIVYFAFVSHLIDWFVLMLSSYFGVYILVML